MVFKLRSRRNRNQRRGRGIKYEKRTATIGLSLSTTEDLTCLQLLRINVNSRANSANV